MISLKKLTLSNFMCIEQAEIDFSDNFLTIFYGDNGQGKSAILEAIALCFTERRRGDSYKDFIKHGAESAKIHLEAIVEKKDIVFDIEIIDKKGISPFQRTISYDTHTFTNSECSTLLQSFDIDYLQHIMFSMQGEGNITDLGPAGRAKLLKRILNFEFTSQIESLEQLIAQDLQEVTLLQAKADTLSARTFQYEALRPEMDASEKTRIAQEIERSTLILKNLEREQLLQAESQQRLTSLQNQFTDVSRRKMLVEQDIKSLNTSMGKIEQDQKRYQSTLASLPEVSVLEEKIKDAVKNIEVAEKLIVQENNFLTSSVPAMEKLQSQVLELSSHIEAHKQGKCPKCGQTTHPENVPEMSQVLADISSQVTTLSRDRSLSTEAIKASSLNIVTWKTEIGKYTNDKNNSQLMRKQYSELLKTLQENLSQSQVTLLQRQETLITLSQSLKDLEEQITQLSSRVIDFSKITSLTTTITTYQKKLQDNDIVHSINETIRQQNQRIKKEEEENVQALTSNSRQQTTLLTNIATYREAKKILEIDLPNYIIVKACSKLEKHLNTFIANVRQDMVVRLLQSRSGVEFFYSPKGTPSSIEEWTSTKMASGFEKELLAVAWRVALAQAYNLSILLLDEIDSAANPASSEKMYRELANLSGFQQLIIITHKPEVVDILLQENVQAVAYQVVNGNFFKQEY